MSIYHFESQTCRLRTLLGILILAATIFPIRAVQAQAVFQVDTWNDDPDINHGDGVCATVNDECTLRAAIEEANTLPNDGEPDIINFTNFPILAWFGVIEVMTPLPEITEAVLIDGTTAGGDVILEGSHTAGSAGLTLESGSRGSTIRGLSIGKFDSGLKIQSNNNHIENNLVGVLSDGRNYGNALGILVRGDNNTIGGIGNGNVIGFNDSGIEVLYAEDALIQGNYIGVDESGRSISNGIGVRVNDSEDVEIGGVTSEHGNIIGFNEIYGVQFIYNCIGSVVRNNYIGTDASGNNLGNAGIGIAVKDCPKNLKIGGKKARGNVIGFNQEGIQLSNADTVSIRGNFIGTDRSGRALGNTHSGIKIKGDPSTPEGFHSTRNIIGYGVDANIQEDASLANTIAFNGTAGIAVVEHEFSSSQAIDNAFRGNSLFANGEAGIELDEDGYTENDVIDDDEGPNNLQNHPEIDRAFYREGSHDIAIEFVVSSDTAYAAYPLTIDAYIADDSISAEGKTYIGTVLYDTADEVGRFEIPADDIDWAPDDVVVLTATDAKGNTSEFSAPSSELDDRLAVLHTSSDSPNPNMALVDTLSMVSLSPPYPNPFNPQTTFTISVSEPLHVRVSVHDLLGRRVALIHNDQLASGIPHTFTVDGSSLASGTYLLRVQTSNFTETRRLTLLK